MGVGTSSMRRCCLSASKQPAARKRWSWALNWNTPLFRPCPETLFYADMAFPESWLNDPALQLGVRF